MITEKQKLRLERNRLRNLQRGKQEEPHVEKAPKRSGMWSKPIKSFQVENNERLRDLALWLNKNKQSALDWHEEMKAKTRPVQRAYMRSRRETDPAFKLLCTLRSRLRLALKAKGASKACRTIELCGCTLRELRVHTEARFTGGMTWENHGKWHVDHIRPCATFDLLDEAQQRECFHFSNLQPMWALDNFRKSNR